MRWLIVLLMLCAPALAAKPTTAPVSTAVNLKAVPQGESAIVAIVVDVPEGLHAQSSQPTQPSFIPFKLTMDPAEGVEIGTPVYPPGKTETYPALGTLSVYTGRVIVHVPIKVKADARVGEAKLTGVLQYQMCDDRVCYRPQKPKLEIPVTVAAAGSKSEPNQPELFEGFKRDSSATTQANGEVPAATQNVTLFGRELVSGAYVFPFIAALVIGAIFNVMPCVLPVVPLKIMSFYETAKHSRARSLALSLVFSSGIVATFAVLGLLIYVVKYVDKWGRLFANTYFLALLVLLLIAFALWQFGVFKFVLPSSIYGLMPQGETPLSNFLFGAFTAILSTPCTFGLFATLLIWAATQPGAIGFFLLVTVGIGMALPYVVLSGFPELAKRFPRTGPWAELVKQMMGFLLLASAVFFARRFVLAFATDVVFWWMLFATVAVAGIFLVARTIQFSPRTSARATAAIVALLLVGPALAFTIRQTNPPIQWQPYSPEALGQARNAGKTVVLEFTADWCTNCIALEASVFHDKRTVKAFNDHEVVPMRADLSNDDAPGWTILTEISPIGAIPLTAVYAPSLPQPIQLSGIYSTDELVTALQQSAKASSSPRSSGSDQSAAALPAAGSRASVSAR